MEPDKVILKMCMENKGPRIARVPKNEKGGEMSFTRYRDF